MSDSIIRIQVWLFRAMWCVVMAIIGFLIGYIVWAHYKPIKK